MTIGKIIRHNLRVCLVLNALMVVFFGNSIMTTYYISKGLTQTQVFELQTTLAVVVVAADVLFGYLADRIGLRKVMILGFCIAIGQGIYFASCQTFAEFRIALVLTGLQAAALQNTTNGMMTLSFKMLGREGCEQTLYSSYLVKSTRISNIAYGAGVLAGGALIWAGGIAMPYYAQPAVYVVCLVFAWKLADPTVTRISRDRSSRRVIVRTLRMMLIERADIRSMIMLCTGFRLFVLLCFWILQPRMYQAGIPVWAYSITYIIWAGSVSAGASIARDAKATGANGLWIALVAIPPIGAIIAGMTTGMFGFVSLMIGLTMITIIVDRLVGSFMLQALPGDGATRNTELAVGSTVPMLVFAIVAPFYGMLVDATSVGFALVAVAVACFLFNGVSFALFRRAIM